MGLVHEAHRKEGVSVDAQASVALSCRQVSPAWLHAAGATQRDACMVGQIGPNDDSRALQTEASSVTPQLRVQMPGFRIKTLSLRPLASLHCDDPQTRKDHI